MQPSFPFQPVVGQNVFFKPVDSDKISYYGIVVDRQKDRWVISLFNASGRMTFDPVTGIAKPWGLEHKLCFVGKDEDFKSLGYNDSICKAQRLLQNHD